MTVSRYAKIGVFYDKMFHFVIKVHILTLRLIPLYCGSLKHELLLVTQLHHKLRHLVHH